MSEWQPIETAPQDTRVLVFMLPWADDDFDDGVALVARRTVAGWRRDDSDDEFHAFTHWQPLPAPPASPSPE